MHTQMFAILNALKGDRKGMNSRELTEKLLLQGISMSDRTVRHYFKILDEQGYTVGDRGTGRTITRKGEEELSRMVAVRDRPETSPAQNPADRPSRLQQPGLPESLHALAQTAGSGYWSVFEGLKQSSF